MDSDLAQYAAGQAYDRQGIGTLGSRPIGGPGADIPALCDTLSGLVGRAVNAGGRVHALADRVFGSRPEPVGRDTGVSAAMPTLANLISELSAALTRIDNGLDRL